MVRAGCPGKWVSVGPSASAHLGPGSSVMDSMQGAAGTPCPLSHGHSLSLGPCHRQLRDKDCLGSEHEQAPWEPRMKPPCACVPVGDTGRRGWQSAEAGGGEPLGTGGLGVTGRLIEICEICKFYAEVLED